MKTFYTTLLFLLISSISIAQSKLDSGLVAFFPFSGNANDESGNNINGFVENAVLTNDRFGDSDKAYYFNGNDARIQIPSDPAINVTDDITISVWFKPDEIQTIGDRMILGKSNYASNTNYLIRVTPHGNVQWEYSIYYQTNAMPLNSDIWYHLVVTSNGQIGEKKIFINGLPASAQYTSSSGAFGTVTNPLTIGAAYYFGSSWAEFFKGSIDDIRIYNRVLDSLEVAALYNDSTTHTPPTLKDGLVLFLPFNGNANDESGNGFNGIIHGATLVQDRYGNANSAFQFNGVSDDITVTHDPLLTLTQQITLTAWVKRTRFGIDMIVEKGGDWTLGTCNYGMSLHYINNNMFYFFFSGGWRGTSGVNDYDWHHYAIVAQQGQQNPLLYIDGELKPIEFSEGASVINLASSSLDLHIGSQLGTYPYYGANIIDDIRIYERLLTEQDIYILAGNKGLVAYYPFNGNANDESGNGNHGTITGALVTPAADRYGEEGKAYKFWYPDYVSVPTNSSFFTDEFTVSYWYKVEAYWGDRCVLSCVGRNGGYQQPFSGTTFQYLFGYNFPTNSWFWANYTVPNTPNTWQHIATTYKKTGDNASITKLYINGELKSSDTYGNTIAYPGSEIFYIGRNHSDLGLNGELDEVRFYNKTLDDQEIKNLYLSETKPVLQSPANQSTVATLTPEMIWRSPLENVEFRFQLSTDSLFSSILHEIITTNLKTQLPDTLLAEGQNYYWRVRTTINGETGPWSEVYNFNILLTDVKNEQQLPTEFALMQNYPNPFNPSTTIRFNIPSNVKGQTSNVILKVYDVLGNEIATLVNEEKPAGEYEVEFNTLTINHQQSSGVYFYQLKAGDYLETKKMLMLK